MRRTEDGQITVMTIGFLVVVGLLVVVVVNASSAFLQRQQLNALADGAALAATDGLSRERFYTEGIDDAVVLDRAAVRGLVDGYLGASGRSMRSVQVSVDDDMVTVRLERVLDLAIRPPGWRSSTVVAAEATSQLRLAR